MTAYYSGADPGFGVRGDEIRQGDLRVLLLLSLMFMERMMQEIKIDLQVILID